MSYEDHGWRHDPEFGTDPVTRIKSSLKQWPIEQEIPLLMSFGAGPSRVCSGFGSVDSGPAVTVPNGAVFNNYKDTSSGGSTTRTAAIGDYFVVCSRIGPKGAQYWWNIGYIRSTDSGTLGLSLAMLTENNDGTVDDPASATYYDCIDPAFYETAYNSTPDWRVSTTTMEGTWDGADGDLLTGVTPSLAATRFTAHGGPGLYAFKFEVKGKEIPSTGYKFGIWGLSLQRSDQAGGFGL